jgi:hypothetical protein
LQLGIDSTKREYGCPTGCHPRTARREPATKKKGIDMNFTVIHIGPLISLIAGILILIMPRLLNYIVALYLIIIGLIGLFGTR